MKKLLVIIAVVILAIFTMLIVLAFITKEKNEPGEVYALIDQLNPLVKEQNSYVKTKNPDEFLEHNRVSYTQKSYDEQGNGRNITFEAAQTLKLDKYLKITHKGSHAVTYEEVKKKDVPKKALKEIE